MTFEPEDNLRLEIGHVLFVDLVGYSKLLIEEQKERLRQLTEMVLATSQVAKSTDEQLVRLPTGDGMALVFRNSSEEPAHCALEIAQALKAHPEIGVRMGVHSGPVSEVTDVSGRTNIAGAGINMAQRVMDCGDAGHILLSQHVADDLAQYRQWAPRLHDLGECEVKHGLRLHLVNLYAEELGNSALPEKFRQIEKKPIAAAAPSPARRKLLRFAPATPILLLIGLAMIAILFAPAAIKVWSHQRAPAPVISASPLAPAIPEKSIAVLPFENLSSDKENVYFAEGIQDEILTKLASIADLKVISRTSTVKYQSKPENLRTVSQQLGVANVLEGTVQRAADKVRVNVQLIDARTDSHRWAESYDRDIKDVFAVESEVSQKIADALQAKLSPAEASTLAAAPTNKPEAYDLFLKAEYEAREAMRTRRPESFDQATAFYQQAIAHDPGFALARARLVENQMLRHWFITRLGEADLDEIMRTAERAVALTPNLPAAHIALGVCYYYGRRQYDQALGEFRRAIELQPNDVRALEYCGFVQLRQGRFQEGLSELEKSEQLDPRDDSLLANIGAASLGLRMWKGASQAGLRALALNPNNVFAMHAVLFSALNGTGDIEEATRILGTFPSDSVLNTNGYELESIVGARAYLDVIKRDFGAALRVWDKAANDPTATRQRLSARAAIYVLAGDAAGTQNEIESASTLVEARLREKPDDQNALIQLAWIDLALKRDSDALGLARKSADLLPPEKDAVGGPSALTGLAQVEAHAGETAEAMKNLAKLLSLPAGYSVSIARLKIDPVWDPIRNDPGFQQLLAGKELIGPPR
ncbi:MAG: adenylate/guanylate cyclase domain-containing protein [Chthoniobacterales bacterium]